MRIKKQLDIFLLILLILLTPACSQQGLQLATATETVIRTEVFSPTLPTVSQPIVKNILVAPQDVDETLLNTILVLLPVLEQNYGRKFDIYNTINQRDLINSELVIAIAPADVIQISQSAPNVKILALGYLDLQPTNNISIVAIDEQTIRNTAFLAGYLSALITTDYRVGVLTLSDTEEGRIVAESFYVGAQYFCGLCSSKFTPIEFYPKRTQISDISDEEKWKSAVEALIDEGVQSVYLSKEVYSADLIDYLMDVGINIVSASVPPKGANTDRWIATLEPDYNLAILNYMDNFTSISSGITIIPEIILTNYSSGLISEGRKTLFEETHINLQAGFIYPSLVP